MTWKVREYGGDGGMSGMAVPESESDGWRRERRGRRCSAVRQAKRQAKIQTQVSDEREHLNDLAKSTASSES